MLWPDHNAKSCCYCSSPVNFSTEGEATSNPSVAAAAAALQFNGSVAKQWKWKQENRARVRIFELQIPLLTSSHYISSTFIMCFRWQRKGAIRSSRRMKEVPVMQLQFKAQMMTQMVLWSWREKLLWKCVFVWCDLNKRRERINERLRILQNLVPSGTKVSIKMIKYNCFWKKQFNMWSSCNSN